MSPALLLPLVALLSATPASRQPHSLRQEVVSCAASLVGQKRLTDLLPRVTDDAAGLAFAAYDGAGVKLLVGRARKQGVAALWRTVVARGALKHRLPRPGDLVFFHDTVDANGNGRLDDGVTHVGVVERVAGDGTVTFIHRGARGVVRSRLNQEEPTRRFDWKGGRLLNDWLREEGHGRPGALAGELFAGYGAASVLTGTLPRGESASAKRRDARPTSASAPGARPAVKVEQPAIGGGARNAAAVRGKAAPAGKVASVKRAGNQGFRGPERRSGAKDVTRAPVRDVIPRP